MNSPVTEIQLHEELSRCKMAVHSEIKKWLDDHEKMEFDKHNQIDQSLKKMSGELEIIIKYFEQGKGAFAILRWLVYAAAAGWAFLVWSKDHIKF